MSSSPDSRSTSTSHAPAETLSLACRRPCPGIHFRSRARGAARPWRAPPSLPLFQESLLWPGADAGALAGRTGVPCRHVVHSGLSRGCRGRQATPCSLEAPGEKPACTAQLEQLPRATSDALRMVTPPGGIVLTTGCPPGRRRVPGIVVVRLATHSHGDGGAGCTESVMGLFLVRRT